MNNDPNRRFGKTNFTDRPRILFGDICAFFRKADKSTRSRHAGCYPPRRIIFAVFPVLVCLFSHPAALAQDKADRSSLIEIKVETSRPHQTAGTGLGVIADIKNVSESKVYLHEKSITMTLPPELEGPFQGARGWWALFPTVWTEPYVRFNNVIALQPGDTYKVFWAKNPGTPATPETPTSIIKNVIYIIRSELNFIFFTPGKYKISVLAQYWTDPSLPKDDYRTVSKSITLQVAAPQSVILLGAALGGLIAYFILPHGRRRLIGSADSSISGMTVFFKQVSKEGAGILGSILLSAMVTILLSRISETQFVIRVTVNDFWGAVAIGFVANYAGSKILDRILPKVPVNQKKRTQQSSKR